jgi:hypothetical protein
MVDFTIVTWLYAHIVSEEIPFDFAEQRNKSIIPAASTGNTNHSPDYPIQPPSRRARQYSYRLRARHQPRVQQRLHWDLRRDVRLGRDPRRRHRQSRSRIRELRGSPAGRRLSRELGVAAILGVQIAAGDTWREFCGGLESV